MATTPQALVDELMAGLDRALGASYAAVLFGSVARGDFIAGLSDINVLIVVDDGTPATLAKLHGPLHAWYEAGQMAPLLLTREEWNRASDVFPIEVVDLQDAHRLLRGADPISTLATNPVHLRLALEADLRGKLLRLRRGYVALHEDPVGMSRLLVSGSSQLVLLFRALHRLVGRDIPREREAVIRGAAAIAGFDAGAILAVDRRRGEGDWRASRAEYESYLGAVEIAVRFVDHLHVGAHA
jgi:predicted nucleotidyltransferase